MSNILDKITAQKYSEVEQLRSLCEGKEFPPGSVFMERKCISLKASLEKENSSGIIAEFKRRSPSKGWFQPEDYPPLLTVAYQEGGAAGCSILTDETFFGGKMEDISLVRDVIDIPILRKDFIIDEIQLRQAKAYGADVVLLIAAILSPQRVGQLCNEAKKYGMEVLLEIHDASELGHICDAVDMVGVNNRNLATFEVNITTSLDLIEKMPAGKTAVSESGITSVEDIQLLRAAGFKGFLIGETFMKEKYPALAFKNFTYQLKQKR
jgi:indole-3-glycerol phosphate synthase